MQSSYSQYVPPMYNWPPKSLWSHGVPEIGEWGDRSIYFHFPFCRNICDFCEYETRKINNIDKINIIGSYLKQIEWNGQFVRRSGNINSIFFGGGTASLMPPAAIEKILDRVASFGGLDERTEITLECEPGTLGKKRLKELRAAGVNRISVCVQSFDDEVLKNITRIHSGADAIRLIDDSHNAGFDNIHLDLMYDLPKQTLDTFLRSVQIGIRLPICHISAYRLYVFKYGIYHKAGFSPTLNGNRAEADRNAKKMIETASDILNSAGFNQYSLTEFAREGKKAKFILDSFGGSDLMPIGPSAFGKLGNTLIQNTPFVHKYIDNPIDTPGKYFLLTREQAYKRYVLMKLWLLEIDFNKMELRTGLYAADGLSEKINRLRHLGELDFDGGKLKLCPSSYFNAGNLMKDLSEIPLKYFCETRQKSNLAADTTDVSTKRAFDVVADIKTLFASARRNEDIFRAIKVDLASTLKKFGLTLDDTMMEHLINVIHSRHSEKKPEEIEILHQEWALIVEQYQRQVKNVNKTAQRL